jgi:hypothetical protein
VITEVCRAKQGKCGWGTRGDPTRPTLTHRHMEALLLWRGPCPSFFWHSCQGLSFHLPLPHCLCLSHPLPKSSFLAFLPTPYTHTVSSCSGFLSSHCPQVSPHLIDPHRLLSLITVMRTFSLGAVARTPGPRTCRLPAPSPLRHPVSISIYWLLAHPQPLAQPGHLDPLNSAAPACTLASSSFTSLRPTKFQARPS